MNHLTPKRCRRKRGRIHTGLFGGGTKSILWFPHRLENYTFGSETELGLATGNCAIHSKPFLAKITGKEPTRLNTSSECREQARTCKDASMLWKHCAKASDLQL